MGFPENVNWLFYQDSGEGWAVKKPRNGMKSAQSEAVIKNTAYEQQQSSCRVHTQIVASAISLQYCPIL